MRPRHQIWLFTNNIFIRECRAGAGCERTAGSSDTPGFLIWQSPGIVTDQRGYKKEWSSKGATKESSKHQSLSLKAGEEIVISKSCCVTQIPTSHIQWKQQ